MITIITAESIKRNRFLYFMGIFIFLFIALLSRWFRDKLPVFMGEYFGDYMSGPMAFCLMGVIFYRVSTLKLGVISLLFACFIEAQQLYRASWILEIRDQTYLGGLIMGHNFRWSDIICLALGVLSATFLEYFYLIKIVKLNVKTTGN